MSSRKTRPTRRDVIFEAWNKTGSQSVGAPELAAISDALERAFGRSGLESPATLARTLADAGIPLRHPEVLEADSVWRETRLYDFFAPGALNFTTLEHAFRSVGEVEDLRLKLAAEGNQAGTKELTQHIRDLKSKLEKQDTELAREVVQWLRVWLQNPQIFQDWLSLRQVSPDFRRKFGD